MCFKIILSVKKSLYKTFKKTFSLIKIPTIFKIVFRNIKKRSKKNKNAFFVTLVAALSYLVLTNRDIHQSGHAAKGYGLVQLRMTVPTKVLYG